MALNLSWVYIFNYNSNSQSWYCRLTFHHQSSERNLGCQKKHSISCPNGNRTNSKWPFNCSETPFCLCVFFSSLQVGMQVEEGLAANLYDVLPCDSFNVIIYGSNRQKQHSNGNAFFFFFSFFIMQWGTQFFRSQKGQHQCIFSCLCSQEACFIIGQNQFLFFSPPFFWPFEFAWLPRFVSLLS